MPLSRRLDDLLAAAEVLTDRADEAEIAASRRRIEAEFAAAAHNVETTRDIPLGLPRTPFTAFLARRKAVGTAPQQAARDLRELSAYVISDTRAAGLVAWLASHRRLNPDGALVFACLLHLADREDSAENLWQFAAGADKPAAAACLHLLHLKRGDVRDARHWAMQTTVIEALVARTKKARRQDRVSTRCRHTPASRLHNSIPDTARLLHTLHGSESSDFTFAAFRACTGALPHSLAQAIQRLHTDADPEYGPITWPDQNLAAQLRENLPA
jgi:hypothetical protein